MRLSPRKKLLDIKSNVALISKPISTDTSLSPKNMNPSESMGLLPIVEAPTMSWGDMVEQEEAEQQFAQQQSLQVQFQLPPEPQSMLTFDQYCQTSGFIDEYLTLQQWRDKYENNTVVVVDKVSVPMAQPAVAHTTMKLDAMENEFLTKNQNEPSNLISTEVTMSSDKKMNMTAVNENESRPTDATNSVKAAPVNDANMTRSNDGQIPRPDEDKPARSDDDKMLRPDEKKIQTADRPWKNAATVIARNMPPMPRNIVQKPAINRLPAAYKKPVVAPKVVTNFPIAMNRSRPMIQRDGLPVGNRRPATAIRPNGVPSNTATRLAARSKTMMDLNKNNVNHVNGAKVREFDSAANAQQRMNDRRSEPKTVSTRMEDDDGWLTVKTRRRTSLNWANRFNQPSGYASLPTLALLNEKDGQPNGEPKMTTNKRDNKKVIKGPPQKPAPTESLKSSTDSVTRTVDSNIESEPKNTNKKPVDTVAAKRVENSKQSVAPNNKTKPVKSTENEKKGQSIVSRATILQRQKSDITGLKINTLRKEYMRIEKSKNKQKDVKKASLNDEEIVDLTLGTSNVELTTDDLKLDLSDLQLCKVMDKIDQSDMTEMDHELNDNVELESDENQRKLLEEQICLERQILELQNTEIEIDTDDADCDTILGIEENESNAAELDEPCHNFLESCEEHDLETKYQHLLSDLSSGERIQTLATLQAFVSRHPGRAQELHQKLSSPSRRRSLHESLKKYQVKQDRAQDMRETLTKEKTLKLQVLLARVEDVKAAKQKLIEEKRLRMEEKLQRYAENRSQYLKGKVRKAHDEEEKLKEIAFIKELEAQNKRLDLLELHKEQEGRLQDLEQERQKRMEEKAAKEAAVERRRLELAKERQKRLEIIDETRRKREQRVEQKQEERDKLRQKIAREKVNADHFFLINVSFSPSIVYVFICTEIWNITKHIFPQT